MPRLAHWRVRKKQRNERPLYKSVGRSGYRTRNVTYSSAESRPKDRGQRNGAIRGGYGARTVEKRIRGNI